MDAKRLKILCLAGRYLFLFVLGGVKCPKAMLIEIAKGRATYYGLKSSTISLERWATLNLTFMQRKIKRIGIAVGLVVGYGLVKGDI